VIASRLNIIFRVRSRQCLFEKTLPEGPEVKIPGSGLEHALGVEDARREDYVEVRLWMVGPIVTVKISIEIYTSRLLVKIDVVGPGSVFPVQMSITAIHIVNLSSGMQGALGT